MKKAIFKVLKNLSMFFCITSGIWGAMLLFLLTSCGMIDFRGKDIATETKGLFLDASVPSFYSTGPSFCSIKFGLMAAKYISAPDKGTAKIKDTYTDINFWSLSGSGTSELSVSNNVTDQTDTPKKNDI